MVLGSDSDEEVRLTQALQMLIKIQNRRNQTKVRTGAPYLDRDGLIVPSDVQPRYRWWDDRIPGSDRLSVHRILVELKANVSVHRSHCGDCSETRSVRTGGQSSSCSTVGSEVSR